MDKYAIGEDGAKSKHIAYNSIVLFCRMFAIMVINLYSVRIVLKALGLEDYGIFNAIAGVILTSTFISSTLATSIQRFYSYNLGKKSFGSLQKIFSASVNIIGGISIIILILFETVGLWLMNTQLTIPEARMYAANWVFQLALFSFILTLIQIPYTASIFAHENMKAYAIISFLDYIGRFIVACLISSASIDNLIFYSIGLLFVASCIFILYVITAKFLYKECQYRIVKSKNIYKELLSFSGWTMYGTISGVAIIQGSAILLNVFFTPITNAAYAIANQIYNAANALCSSIILSFRPVMIKSFAENRKDYLLKLFEISNKTIAILLLCITIPAILEMRTILTWWLGELNEEIVFFSRLFLVYLFCFSLNNPITTIVQATGKVRSYYLLVDSITLLCLPFSWVLFRMGLPSYFVFITMISLAIIAHFVRLICLQHCFPPYKHFTYFTSFVLPYLVIAALTYLSAFYIHTTIDAVLLRFIVIVIASPIITILFVFFIGIKKQERHLVHAFVQQLLKRK